jgi:hypothetical protein
MEVIKDKSNTVNRGIILQFCLRVKLMSKQMKLKSLCKAREVYLFLSTGLRKIASISISIRALKLKV